MTRRPHRSVLLVGTGAFATGMCRALARRPALPTEVYVLGRSRSRAAAVCAAGARVAAVNETPLRFRALAADLAPGCDLRPAVCRLAPRIAVVCASYQSPRQIWRGADRWSALVREAGFLVTVPLQAALAERVAAACAEVGGPGTSLLNACFPDAVNPILAARGLPVLGGLGNVGTLAAAACEPLGITESRLKLLAHHAHLHAPDDPTLDVRCWVDDREQADSGSLLGPIRSLTRAELNRRGAATAGRVVRALLDEDGYTGHLPGPAGRPGGYPVRIRGRSVELRLPPGMSEHAADRWTARISLLDGGTVGRDGTVRFTERTAELLDAHWPDRPRKFTADAVHDLCRRQLEVRERMRWRSRSDDAAA